MQKCYSFCSLMLTVLLSRTRNENNMSYSTKKIVNEIVGLSLEQHYKDIQISKSCNISKLLIISCSTNNYEAYQSVCDFVCQLQNKIYEKCSLLSTHYPSYLKKDCDKKNLSYPLKASFLWNEKSKNKTVTMIIFKTNCKLNTKQILKKQSIFAIH